MPKPNQPRQPRYERLTAWQACHQLTQAVDLETFRWPLEHQEWLATDLRRSLTNAVTHIMIGSFEPDARGFRRELGISLGKLARFDCGWEMARELKLVESGRWGEIEAKRDHAEHLVRGLSRALGRRPASPKPS